METKSLIVVLLLLITPYMAWAVNGSSIDGMGPGKIETAPKVRQTETKIVDEKSLPISEEVKRAQIEHGTVSQSLDDDIIANE